MSVYKKHPKIPFFTVNSTKGMTASFLEEHTLPTLRKLLDDVEKLSLKASLQSSSSLMSAKQVLSELIEKIESVLSEAKEEEKIKMKNKASLLGG